MPPVHTDRAELVSPISLNGRDYFLPLCTDYIYRELFDMKAKDYIFSLEMKVRDYECDLQGVVNNANYQHYMEHARHEFWESFGANFGQMHEAGLDAFVYKVTITYRKSLRSGDKFRSALNCRIKSPKLIFEQDILMEDGSIAAHGEVEVVAVQDGVVTRGEYFQELLKDIIK